MSRPRPLCPFAPVEPAFIEAANFSGPALSTALEEQTRPGRGAPANLAKAANRQAELVPGLAGLAELAAG